MAGLLAAHRRRQHNTISSSTRRLWLGGPRDPPPPPPVRRRRPLVGRSDRPLRRHRRVRRLPRHRPRLRPHLPPPASPRSPSPSLFDLNAHLRERAAASQQLLTDYSAAGPVLADVPSTGGQRLRCPRARPHEGAPHPHVQRPEHRFRHHLEGPARLPPPRPGPRPGGSASRRPTARATPFGPTSTSSTGTRRARSTPTPWSSRRSSRASSSRPSATSSWAASARARPSVASRRRGPCRPPPTPTRRRARTTTRPSWPRRPRLSDSSHRDPLRELVVPTLTERAGGTQGADVAARTPSPGSTRAPGAAHERADRPPDAGPGSAQNGHPVGQRGFLSADAVEVYREAHGLPTN